jgi:hypothetical protein
MVAAEEEPIEKHASASIKPIVGQNRNQSRNQNIVIYADAPGKIQMCQEPEPEPKPEPKR